MGCSFSGLNALYDAVNGGGDVWINDVRFRILRQLGEGGFAFVFLVNEVPADNSSAAGAGLASKVKDKSHLSEVSQLFQKRPEERKEARNLLFRLGVFKSQGYDGVSNGRLPDAFSNGFCLLLLHQFLQSNEQPHSVLVLLSSWEVWNDNFQQELYAMEACLGNYPIVSVDTEFPGCLRETLRYDPEEVRFEKMKFNVGATYLIQLGLTLCNSNGTVGGVWQFNFHFDCDRDLHSKESIQFLAGHGIDFQKLKTHGVDRVKFGAMFGAVIGRRQRAIIWVSFHGVYDYAYIVKALTFRPVAESPEAFVDVLGRVFDSVVDVKYMAGLYKETGSEIGLQKLADALGVRRVGEAHTAASDSFLTALVYFELNQKLLLLGVEEELYRDFVYGTTTRILRKQKEPPRLVYHHHPYQYHQHPYQVVYPVPYHYQQRVSPPNMIMGRWVGCSY